MARIVAAGLGETLGQPVVVENRAGSNGVIAADAVARAAHDGYTLLFSSVTTATLLPALGQKLSFNPLTELAPVSLVARVPTVLVVGKAMPVNTVGELLAYAKTHDGGLNYASSGVGSTLHLSMEMLKSRTGMRATHIPYKGGVQAYSDLMSGQVHVMFDGLPTEMANIKAGSVRALAISSARRHPKIPDVPTMSEAGFPGFESEVWYAVFVPSTVSPAIVEQLNRGIVAALRSDRVREGLQQLGAEAESSTAEAAVQRRKAEVEKWTAVIRRAGIRLEESGS